MTVYATLGGGRHGHLVLVLSPADYAAIPNTRAYVRPAHPGILTIPNNSTQSQSAQLQDAHQES